MEKKKIKEIKLPMKFNPGTMRYEPVLPKKIKNEPRKNSKSRKNSNRG